MKYRNYLRPSFYRHRFNRSLERLRLKRFRKLHASQKRCFLVGNGPSIQQQDLTQLKNEVVFVTNHFVLHDEYEHIAPNYYCVCDSKMFERGTNQAWSELMYKKAYKTTKFFPYSSRKMIHPDSRYDNNSVYYLNYLNYSENVSGKVWNLNEMILDPTKGVYSGDTIMIDYCIPLAFYMGFTEIYLLGCDCDYGLDKANDFSKGYFFDPKLATTERQTVNYLQKHWRNNVFQSYQVAKDTLETRGCKIYNSTIGGKLEVFERKDFNEVLDNKLIVDASVA